MVPKRNQQKQVYAAEAAAQAKFDKVELSADLLELQRWVRDEICDTDWWFELVDPHLDLLSFQRCKGTTSGAGLDRHDDRAGLIGLFPSQHNLWVVVHEIAHCVAEAVHGSHAHDPWFVRTYLELIWYVLGPEQYLAHFDAFNEQGVEIGDAGIAWQRKAVITL